MQLKWYEHVKRTSDSRLARKWLNWKATTTHPPDFLAAHENAGWITLKQRWKTEEANMIYDLPVTQYRVQV